MKFSPGVVPQWPSSRGLMCSGAQRLAQQRVVEQVDLPDGQVVRGAPPGVEARELLARQRQRGLSRGHAQEGAGMTCRCASRESDMESCGELRIRAAGRTP